MMTSTVQMNTKEVLKDLDSLIIEEESSLTFKLIEALIAGIIAGLIALVTPCVFPMIPLTVSFF